MGPSSQDGREPTAAIAAGLEAATTIAALPGAIPDRERRRQVDALLGQLAIDSRAVALALTRPPPGVIAPWPGLASELRGLAEADRSMSSTVGSPARASEVLWRSVRTQAEADPVAATLGALRLWLERLFPLSMTEPGHVTALTPGPARDAVALAVGLGAAAGQRTAASMARALLADASVPEALHRVVIQGAGGGLLEVGLHRVATWAAASLDDGESLRLALLHATRCCATVCEEATLDLLAESWLFDPDASDPHAWIEAVSGLPSDDRDAHLRRLALRFRDWPAAVRTALLPYLEDKADRARAWRNDLSPAVALAGMGELVRPLDPPTRAHLAQLLSHQDRTVREEATAQLAHDRAPGPTLQAPAARAQGRVVNLPSRSLTRSPLDRVRAALVDDEPEHVPALVAALPDDEEQRAGARAALLAVLALPDAALRRAGVEGLAAVGNAGVAGSLLRAARRVRGLETLAVSALRAAGVDDQHDALVELFDRRLKWADDEAVDDFIALSGDRAGPELVQALATRYYPPARTGAARAIARGGFKEAIFTLRNRGLTDPNVDARRAALAALEALSGSGPTADLASGYALLLSPIDDLDDAMDRVRTAGARALPGLRSVLANGSWRRRVAACEALAHVAGQGAEEVLVATLLDADEDVRLASRRALAERGWEPKAPEAFTLAAMAERQFDRLLARPDLAHLPTLERGLALGGHVFRSEAAAVLAALERVTRWHPRPEIAAALAVTRLDPAGALEEPDGELVLLRAIDRTWQLHPHRAVLTWGLRAVSPARLGELATVESWGWRAREALCHALARAGDSGCVPGIRRFVLDTDEDVRRAAIDALVAVGTREAALALADGAASPFQEDGEAIARGLAAMGRAALPALTRLAASEWWEERRAAALALRDWRRERQEAVDLALPLAVDPEYRVAEAARMALDRHGLAPRPDALRRTLVGSTELTLTGLEPWLRLDPRDGLHDESAREVVCELLRGLSPDALPHRLGLASSLRLDELRPWLATLAGDAPQGHVGVRLTAARVLRALDDSTCRMCRGRGTVGCVGCEGDGEQACADCAGRGSVRRGCPDPECDAGATMRRLDRPPCKTCRGRGVITETCGCGSGRVPCHLCHGTGRTVCLVCGGIGELSAEDESEAAEVDTET